MGRGWGTPEERELGCPLEELGCTWTRGLGPQWSTPDPTGLRGEAVGTSQAALAGPWDRQPPGHEVDEGRACQIDSKDSGKRVVTEMEPVYAPTIAAQPAPSSPTPRRERLLFHIHGPWEADPETHSVRESWVHP